MKYELIESGGEWIVEREGVELARFEAQAEALDHVAGKLRDADPAEGAALRLRYQARA